MRLGGWLFVDYVSLILRSDSEDSAGKGHSDSVVPPAGDECVFGVGFILLLRLAARCRCGLYGGEGQGRFGFGCFFDYP